MKTAVVILNYNGKHWLDQFLPSVIEHTPTAEIWVADNASTDDSVEFMREKFPEVHLLVNAKNEGYAGGYNEALSKIDAQVFVLLNSDIEVSSNWLPPLVQALKDHPELAAVQPKVRSHALQDHFEHAGASGGFLDVFGYPLCRGRLFNKVEVDQGQYDTPLYTFWATGACLVIRSSDFHEAGGLDARFFAHMEEIDLCWRLQRQNKFTAVIPESVVYHVGGGTLNTLSPRKTFLNFRNNLFMLFKNLPKRNLIPLLVFRMFLDGLAGVKFLVGMQPRHFLAVIQAHSEFYRNISYLKKERGKIPGKPPFSSLKGVYPHSIVWAFFGKKLNYFNQLDQGFTEPLENASKANS